MGSGYMKREAFAAVVILLLLVVFPASLFAYQGLRTRAPGVRVIELQASAPGAGDWQPKALRLNVGERVRLRIASTDVVHGFIAPGLGLEVDEILPGHVAEIEFTPQTVGRYAFACQRWCSVDHWRMRGVIEVVDPNRADAAPPAAGQPPPFQQQGIDIDAMHPASSVPAKQPSAGRGQQLALALPAQLADAAYLRNQPPAAVYERLRADTAFAATNDDDLWDAVAFAYLRAAGADSIKRGEALFGRDCAACHGAAGKGDGPAGKKLPGLTAMHPEMKPGPADLSDAETMLGASDVLLQGKVLRGGMGTGMPEWRSLYSDADLWDVVHYLRTLVFGR